MNDRLVTVGGVLLAALIVAGIFVQDPGELPVSRPTSAETAANGYQALERWLVSQGVNTLSFRERYDKLSDAAGASGNLMISTLPHSRAMRADEAADLMDWIRAGNTLVVLAALNDTPDWALTDTPFIDDLETLTGTLFEAALDEQDEAISVGEIFEETELALHANPHPLMQDVNSLIARSDSVASIWVPAEESAAPGEPLASEASTGFAAAWATAMGSGHVITIATGSLLTNRALGKADNRQLFANLILWHLAPYGTVIFDDMHQGLSTLYDPDAFYSDSRLGITLLFVLAFWFLYMVGTHNRMAPVREQPHHPHQGEYVAAIGGFLARKLAPGAIGLLMFEQWFAHLSARSGLPDDTPPWEHLAASPTVDPELLALLKQKHQQLAAGHKLNLQTLHNEMRQMREATG